MDYIEVNSGNLSHEHICCALAGGRHEAGVSAKKEWMAARFCEGLAFRKAAIRGKVFIEYMPGAHSFRPVHAPDCLVIHCLWVSGRYKGQGLGADLLRHCLAQEEKAAGVAVVAGNKPFLTSPDFYRHHGFQTVDETASGFELMLYGGEGAQVPYFMPNARHESIGPRKGVTFQIAAQCPFGLRQLQDHQAVAAAMGLVSEVQWLRDRAAIEQAGSPFGTYGVFLEGKLISHEMNSAAAFEKTLARKLLR